MGISTMLYTSRCLCVSTTYYLFGCTTPIYTYKEFHEKHRFSEYYIIFRSILKLGFSHICSNSSDSITRYWILAVISFSSCDLHPSFAWCSPQPLGTYTYSAGHFTLSDRQVLVDFNLFVVHCLYNRIFISSSEREMYFFTYYFQFAFRWYLNLILDTRWPKSFSGKSELRGGGWKEVWVLRIITTKRGDKL